MRKALGLEAEHDGDSLDVVAGEDFVLALRDSDLVQGLGLPEDLDFEGLEAGEGEVKSVDCLDERVEASVVVGSACFGVDVQAEMLESANGKLLREEERQFIAAEMTCAHAAGVGLDEDFQRGAGHDGREEEYLLELVVAGIVLPV